MKDLLEWLSVPFAIVILLACVISCDYYYDVYKLKEIGKIQTDKCYGYTVIDADHVVTCDGDTLIHCWQIPKCK